MKKSTTMTTWEDVLVIVVVAVVAVLVVDNIAQGQDNAAIEEQFLRTTKKPAMAQPSPS